MWNELYCKSICTKYPETQNKSGYYCIKGIANGNFISTCAGMVWEEDGEELLILTSVQEMTVRVSGGRPQILVLASVEWPVMNNLFVLLQLSLLME